MIAEVPFATQCGERVVGVARSDYVVEVLIGNKLGSESVDNPIQSDGSPKSRHGVSASASRKASGSSSAHAKPHGFPCLMIATDTAPKSRTQLNAASTSRRLLNESSFPWSFRALTTVGAVSGCGVWR